MDNLIHASANDSDAEREIKLWFKPSDIPPPMHAFDTATSNEHYYFKNGKLSNTYVQGSICLFAPGDTVWKTDLEALRLHSQGLSSDISVQAVAAKYLINLNV